MSDPKALSEKIWRKIHAIWDKEDQFADPIKILAEELRAALNEARKEERDLCQREIDVAHKIVEGVEHVNNHILDVAKEAKASAYDDCAKIMFTYCVCSDVKDSNGNHWDNYDHTNFDKCRCVKAIRQHKAEECK